MESKKKESKTKRRDDSEDDDPPPKKKTVTKKKEADYITLQYNICSMLQYITIYDNILQSNITDLNQDLNILRRAMAFDVVLCYVMLRPITVHNTFSISYRIMFSHLMYCIGL